MNDERGTWNENVDVLGLAEGCAIDDNLLNSTETNLFCQHEFILELKRVFARRCARAASGVATLHTKH